MVKNEVFGPHQQWSMVMVYDPKTGQIVHMHQAVTTQGGTHPDQSTLEKLAAGHAARARNMPVDGMAFLHVNPSEVELDGRYTVDVKSRSLRKVDPPKPRS